MLTRLLALCCAVLFAPTLQAQLSISTVSPSTAVPGLTTVTITASGFPSGSILLSNVSVVLAPAIAGSGAAITVPASGIASGSGTIRQITFLTPSTLTVLVPTAYLASLTDAVDNLSSTNTATLTINPNAQISGVAPNSGSLGQSVAVTLSGQYSNFLQGTSTVSAGAGITVSKVAVSSPATLTATFLIDKLAVPGLRTVTVNTGAEIATGAFTINPGQAVITSLTPSSIGQGQTLNVSVTATNANFAPGVTNATGGAGITVNSVTVADANHLAANVTIDPVTMIGPRTLTLTTGTTVASAALFVIAGPAAVSSLSPNSVTQGQNVTVTVTGLSTHFAANTTAGFGAGITVKSVTAISATSAAVDLIVQDTATPGRREVSLVTAGETARIAGGFTVTQSAPVLLTAVPPTGVQGQIDIPIALTSRFTHFVNGTSVASFGTGIRVSSLVVADATHATARIIIDPQATPGTRTLTITTGTEIVMLAAGFTVQPASVSISSVAPSSGRQGQTLTGVAVIGSGTHFVSGTTKVSFSDPAIAVSSISVGDGTHLTATLGIGPTALTSPASITVVTGGETAIGIGAFTVAPGNPVLLSINPPTGQPSQTLTGVSIVGSFTHFAPGTTTLLFGNTGVTASAIAVIDSTHLSATLTIAASATRRCVGCYRGDRGRNSKRSVHGRWEHALNHPVDPLVGSTRTEIGWLRDHGNGNAFFTGNSSRYVQQYRADRA